MKISPSDEHFGIAPFMKLWLDGKQDWFNFSNWSDRQLLVLWWGIAVFLHAQYGGKLEHLESVMMGRGMKIPRKEDGLLDMTRRFG